MPAFRPRVLEALTQGNGSVDGFHKPCVTSPSPYN